MKSFYWFLLLILSTSPGFAQRINIDQQKIEAGIKKPDSNFVKYLLETALVYSKSVDKNDSAESFFTKAIMVAEQIRWFDGLLQAREMLGQYYQQKGKLSQALNVLLKNEAAAIEKGDSTTLFTTLRLVAMVYMRTGDSNMARSTLERRQFILDNNGIKGLKDTSYYVLSQYNSLAVYYNMKQVSKPDSAGYYFRKLYVLGRETADSSLFTQLGSGGLGQYFYFKGLYDSAIHYLDIAKVISLKDKRYDNYFGFLNTLSKAYQQSGQLDSAFFYAYKVYNGATNYSYLALIAASSGVLASLYKQQHAYDSAMKYMVIEMQYKDSISGQETLRNVQLLTSEQQVKDQEKQRQKEEAVKEYKASLRNWLFTGGLILLLGIIAFMYRVNKQRDQSKKEIEAAYHNLKATQTQLIQSEKMASLGELTAGIAHEIQNPLNFVNNFSELNAELIDEATQEISKGNIVDVKIILNDIKENEQKINHHGKRADAIVKGMLQHSRSSSGQKEPTDINALCDEYLRLSYHGLRAKDKSFNATIKTDFDNSIGNINIIPQDIGRVILNLLTNAFYAVQQKAFAQEKSTFQKLTSLYQPTVSIGTKKEADKVLITVCDNGNGIPQNIADKIFQPFFTTKPTGQGTGLGLSLSYDIVKAHSGELKVETKEGEGSQFFIYLPLV